MAELNAKFSMEDEIQKTHEERDVETIQTLKRSCVGHIAYLTRSYRDIETLMNSYDNLELVKGKVVELEASYNRFLQAHNKYTHSLVLPDDQEAAYVMLDNQYKGKMEFDEHVQGWISQAKSKLQSNPGAEEDDRQIKSPSVHGSEDSLNGSIKSRGSRTSTSSKLRQAKVREELAKMNREHLKRKLEIEKRKQQMETEMQLLEADNDIAKAQLEKKQWEDETQQRIGSSARETEHDTQPKRITSSPVIPTIKRESSPVQDKREGKPPKIDIKFKSETIAYHDVISEPIGGARRKVPSFVRSNAQNDPLERAGSNIPQFQIRETNIDPRDGGRRKFQFPNPNAEEWHNVHPRFLSVNEIGQNDSALQNTFHDVMQGQQRAFQTMANAMKDSFDMPKPELLKFNGNPTEYWKFINNFEANIADRVHNYRSKLNYLIQHCLGEARANIEDCGMLDPRCGYEEARKILYMEYGRPHIIAQAYVGRIVNGPIIKLSDSEGLMKLSHEMRKCELTLSQMGYSADINNSDNLLRIMWRLPIQMQSRWADRADQIIEAGMEPTFKDFSAFIQNRARVANNLYGKNVGKFPDKDKVGRMKSRIRTNDYPRRVTTMAVQGTRGEIHAEQGSQTVRSPFNGKFEVKCPSCTASHNLVNCPEFKKLVHSDRVNIVRTSKLCYNCFKRGHIAKGCLSKSACEIIGCRRKHHTLLHHPMQSSKNDNNSQIRASDNKTPADPEISNSIAHCNTVSTSQRVCLRILPVRVKANNHEVETYALLDEGSDVSLCNKRLIQDLGLDGVERNFNLTTINKQESNVKGIEVGFSVSAVDSDECVEIPKVWAIDHLPISLHSIPSKDELNEWSHLKGLNFPKIDQEKVMLLIGSDVPEVFWVLDERRGRRKEPYAIRSLLGWSSLGPTKRRQSELINGHVNLVTTQDELLQQQVECLWKTEFNDVYSGSDVGMSKEDKLALFIMESSVTKNNGHYQLSLPWRNNMPNLPNNRKQAEL